MNSKYTSGGARTMLRKVMLIAVILCGGFLHQSVAQVFWTETFGTGCNQGQLAISAVTANGSWTVTPTGVNDPFANEWFISAAEAGFPAGTCRDGCTTNGALTNQTLHIGIVAGSPNSGVLCPTGDCGATYDPGGFTPNQVTSHRRIESPFIDCTGKSTITLSFNYFENGDLSTDNATLWYYNGSIWSQLADPPKTSTATCGGLGLWTAVSIPLPATANNNANVKIGFEWVNDDDASGTSPSFVVDDVKLSIVPTAVVANFTVDTINGGCAGLPRQFTDQSTGAPTGWLWSFPGGTPNFSTSQNPVITYSLPGTYTVSLAAYNISDTDTVIRSNYLVVVNCTPPVANFTANNTVICQNHCINFTDLSQNNPTGWQWSFPNSNTPASNLQNPTNICYSTPGAYNVQLIASNSGGTDTLSIPLYITINNCPPPTADFASNTNGGCDTVCIDFFDLSTSIPGPVIAWHWYFPGGTPNVSSLQNPTNICYTADGLYDVILTVDNGNGTDSIIKYSFINVTSVPTATINGDTTMPVGNSYQLLAGGGSTYYWFSPGLDSAQLALDTNFVPNPIASPQYTTTYYCFITDGTGCSTIRQLTVYITRENRIFLPDAFSPNGDGQNELFRVRGNNIFSARLTVFDRWGEKIFETTDKSSGWDGTYKGEKLNVGVYSYYTTVIFDDGKQETQTGTIALIR